MATYTKIQTVTIGSGGNAAIAFTSIPSTFNDLLILTSNRGSNSTTTFGLTINGSSVSSFIRMYGGGSGTVASDFFNESYTSPSGSTASVFGIGFLYFPSYTSSSNKAFLFDSAGEGNVSGEYMGLNTGTLNSSSVISSISLVRTSGNFVEHSTATLYGIKKV